MPSLPSVYFAAAVAGATFFGVYAILTFAALYLLSHRERSVTAVVMIVLTVVMFGISTIFFALDIRLISDGILHPLKYPRTIDISGPERTTQIICQGVNTVLGDSIVIWRAWVVWERRLPVVIVPLVLLVGVAFSSFGMAFSQARAFHDPYYRTAFQKFIIALPCLTLATNVAATSLVLSRVLALQFSMRRMERLDRINSIISHGAVRYRRLIKIMIESGGMYCLTWLILLCLVLSGSTAIHVFLSIIGQLTGIYPTLIIVLVSLNMTQDRHGVQGPVVDTGIKFDSNVAPETTCMRTVSYTLGRAGSSGVTIGDVETGGALETGAGLGCGVDATKASSCESRPDPKEYVVDQDT